MDADNFQDLLKDYQKDQPLYAFLLAVRTSSVKLKQLIIGNKS